MLKLLANILTAPVSVPVRGVVWVAEEVLDAARRDYYDVDAIRAQLEVLNGRLEAGEIDEPEFLERESALLDRLEEAERWWAEEEST